MRKYLTIGELADLMKITTSSIRYYEKEGLLSPFKIDDNGYRLYDFNEIDILETILLLRKMDVPLKQLKAIINNNSIDDYIDTLKLSLESIDSKIKQLNNKRQYVVKKIDYVQNYMNVKSSYHVKHFHERVLYCIHTGNIFEYSIKDTYEIMKTKNINYLEMFQDSYVIQIDDDNYSLCMSKSSEVKYYEDLDKIILPEGLYLNYDFFVKSYEMIDNEIDKFYDYMKKNDFSPIGKLMVIENSRFSDFYLKTINFNLQILIKNNTECFKDE